MTTSAAVKLMRRLRQTGSITPERIGGHRRPVLTPHHELLRCLVEGKSGITLAQIQAELQTRGIVVQALSTIHLMLKRMGLALAPLVVDGPMRGEIFKAYVEQMLAPAISKGDVVVLDNLAAHKVEGLAEAIRAAGASLLYLPPYSPDLNPIEQLFSRLKALLRKAGARTKEALWTTTGELLDEVSPEECSNYLTNCGYEPV